MFPPLVSLWRPRRAGNPALRNAPRPHVRLFDKQFIHVATKMTFHRIFAQDLSW